jgi:hypothetical protein
MIPFLCEAQIVQASKTTVNKKLPVDFHQRFISLAKQLNRWGQTTAIPISQKSGTRANANGVRYFINKGTLPVLPAQSTGTTQTQTISNDLVVCKVTPKTIARQLSGVFFIGTPANSSQSLIYPGALFKDDLVVQGDFTPLSLPRKAGSITIDVLNLNGTISENVSNFNDKTTVTNAINALRTKTGNSYANTYLQKLEASFESSSQINALLDANMNVNLQPIIELPAQVGGEMGGNLTIESSLNAAVAAICQVYYTISLGGSGPKSTVEGTIPSNALCVTDVFYGRSAFLTVGSYSSRFEASAVQNQLLSFGIDENVNLVDAERRLSASAKFALRSGYVKLTVTGGSVASAVTVSSLQTLRDYIEKIDPTVSGVQAVPLFYMMRYAADEAPANMGAFASYTDKECFRADQLKITLQSIRPAVIDDWGGDEELYGSIGVEPIGKVYSGSPALWNVASSSYSKAKILTNIVSATPKPAVVFNLNPVTTSASSVNLNINIKDKILSLPDPEFIGATEKAKEDGYVLYKDPTHSSNKISVSLADIKNAPNGILNQAFTVRQGDNARVEVVLKFELINNRSVQP